MTLWIYSNLILFEYVSENVSCPVDIESWKNVYDDDICIGVAKISKRQNKIVMKTELRSPKCAGESGVPEFILEKYFPTKTVQEVPKSPYLWKTIFPAMLICVILITAGLYILILRRRRRFQTVGAIRRRLHHHHLQEEDFPSSMRIDDDKIVPFRKLEKSVGEILAQGNFGVVYYVKYEPNRIENTYAIKKSTIKQ